MFNRLDRFANQRRMPFAMLTFMLCIAFALLVVLTSVIAMPRSALSQGGSVCSADAENTSTSPLLINEIMARNDGVLIDPADNKDNEDWIELYNSSNITVDLQGFYLSDRPGAGITKHRITESLTIGPFGFVILFADGDTNQGPNHLSFKLNKDGDRVILTESDGVTVVDDCLFSAQEENIPIGRLPDGGEWVYLSAATPGRPNAFVPVISQVLNQPEIPDSLDFTTVSAVVTDDISVNRVTLYYYDSTSLVTAEADDFTDVFMTNRGNNNYEAIIPGFSNETLVSYFIEAVDNSGNKVLSPIDAPTATHKYLVGYEPPMIAINEFVADNVSGLMDPHEPLTATVSNKYPDWFEIYNYGSTDVDLNGLYLTDDRYNPTKNPITSVLRIAPGQTIIFYADEDRTQGIEHVNFRLAAGGETIAIFGPYGAAPIDVVDFGPQPPDRAVGRYPDGLGDFSNELCPSPRMENIQCDLKNNLPVIIGPNTFASVH